MARRADYSLNDAENTKLIRHIEAGGIRSLLYGGNANFYHVGMVDYDETRSYLEQAVAPDTLVIPSAGPALTPCIAPEARSRDRASAFSRSPVPRPGLSLFQEPGPATVTQSFPEARSRDRAWAFPEAGRSRALS